MRPHRIRAFTLMLLIAATPAIDAAQPNHVAPMPAQTNVRYDEDWSVLATYEVGRLRPTERAKFIPLGRTAQAYVTTGLELRLRNETYENNLWGGAAASDDGFVWLRALPYADLHARRLRAFVQPIAAYASGVEPAAGPIDETRLDWLQGFIDATLHDGANRKVTMRGGRAMMPLGSERLIGTRYGPNVPLAFDGARLLLQLQDRLQLDMFYVRPVEPGLGDFDDDRSRTKSLWGAYATRELSRGEVDTGGIDFYYLGFRDQRAAFDAGDGREKRHSIGTRIFGHASNWHWNTEAVAQFGQFANSSIRAWTLATEGGYHFRGKVFEPDVALRFNVASGDRNSEDNRLETFNALFPKGKYFGELSPVGPYNLINVQPSVVFKVTPAVELGFAINAYWRQSTGDGLYGVPGNLLRPAEDASKRHIGNEAEMSLAWQISRELAVAGSVGAFAPGEFIRETGEAETIYMLGLETAYRF